MASWAEWAELLPAGAHTWILLAALPLLLASCTAFTKISIALAALRQGLGAERILPLASVLALGLVITAVVMAPVVEASVAAVDGLGGPAVLAEASSFELWTQVLDPLRQFLTRHAAPEELERFASLAEVEADSDAALIPAFLLSELRAGFGLAVGILVPFVVIDLIAAELLVLLGLQHTPTKVVGLPAKLLLFLAADGWGLIVSALIEGYR